MVLRNEKGTAPGMWFEERGKIYVSMPGVPYEMKSMMKEQVLPKLKNDLDLPHIVMHTVLTQGIGESFLSEKITGWEEAVAKDGIKLAYLPSAGSVRLRLSITSRDLASAESLVKNHVLQLEKIIPGYIYGNEEEDLPKVVGKLLQGKGLSVSTAESCTGGYIAHLLTQYPGSSAFYKGSMITYSDDIKTDQLAIDPIIIEQKGAVSEDVAIGMAESVRIKMNTDFAISCTGIAGPDGGSEEKPVGTVWIGISGNGSAYAKKYRFGGDRTRNIEITAMTALNMLRKEILKLT
jgi:nicotinamide-nucleotide amidase